MFVAGNEVAAAQEVFISERILRRVDLKPLGLCWRKIQTQSFDDLFRNAILHRQQLVILNIDRFSPQNISPIDIDELSRYSQVVAVSQEATGHHLVHTQFPGYYLRV